VNRLQLPLKQNGFTLIELIIVSALIGVIAVVISQFYSNRLTDYAREFTTTELESNTKQALETMQLDIKSAQYVEANNNLSDAYNTGGWTTGISVLVLQVPALDSSGNPIWIDGYHTSLWSNEIVYFVSGNVLYRRLLANSNAPGDTAVSTCPAGTGGGCPVDGKVIENVASMQLQYFDDNNATTTLPNLVHTIGVTLTQSQSTFGNTYTSTLTSSATLRNR
jgi:prepilin-type N-terminal cleavage/methylation domain-containing protein